MIDNSVQSRDNNDHEIQSDNEEEEKVQIRFSQEDHKNSVVSFKGSGNTNEADERVINEFKRRSIIKSSFCDDLKLKDMSVKI